MELFSTAEAAEFLGLSVAGLKYHLYVSGVLRPDKKIGQALIFTRETLERFQRTNRPPGRPPVQAGAPTAAGSAS